jgi:GT2 family glycosyltransferase
MDDDNVAKPGELSTFVQVAQRTGADMLTAFMDLFSGSDAPPAGQVPGERYLFLGAAAAVGAFTNCFGDANMLVRRDVFLALGGFVEERDYAHQDWELLARAVLQGFHLEVVPEALFHYRIQPDSMVRTTQRYANLSGSFRPYLQALPASLRPALMVAHGLMLELGTPLPAPPPKRPEPTALNLKVKKMLSPKWRNSFRKRLATLHEWFTD